jgi:two-component system, NtrC family, sensor histidine kinase HydH
MGNMLALWIWLIIGALAAGPAWVLLARWRMRQTVRRTREIASAARRKEHLVEVGTLIGGLAHEIKNPLSTVKVNLQLLTEDLDAPGADESQRRMRRRLAGVSNEVTRLQEVLDDFLRFAGKHELKPVPVDLRQVVSDLTDFFSPQAAATGVRVRMYLTDQPIPVRVDVDLFKQALLNLLINAQQAMTSGGGELILRAERDGRRARVEVIDTGPGMAPEVAEKVFQAYYSTKAGGTGLGLPTAHRIIREHDGQITVDTAIGRGSRFVIHLPLDKGPKT